MKILKYENNKYEILLQKHLFIKDKSTNTYYHNSISSIDENTLNEFSEYQEKIPFILFLAYIIFNTLMIIINYFYVLHLHKQVTPEFSKDTLIIVIFYFITNIFFHELGHIYSLKFFGKNWDKCGVKLNFYVFPAFYVQLNETYMLSRRDKILVHSFGLFVNYTFINILQIINLLFFQNYNLTLSFMLFSSTLIWNLIPMLNSDGYKLMLACLSLDEFHNFTKNHWLVLLVQGIGIIIAVNTLIHWLFYWENHIF